MPTYRFSACKFLIEKGRERDDRNSKKNSQTENNGRNAEISIHGKLKHKYIPPIYGYYKIKYGTCIAMEYSKYGDLENFKKNILKRSTLSESFICYFVGQILEALFYLSINKIIHMDIKLQNILIDEYLTAKRLFS
jgi:serine/threonine protein kinase